MIVVRKFGNKYSNTLHFLTEVFNLFVGKYSYFNTNNLTLKRFTTLLATLLYAILLTAQNYNNIEFIENKGQWDSQVKFMGSVSGGAFFIRSGGVTIVQHNREDLANISNSLHGYNQAEKSAEGNKKMILRSHAFNIDFVGANPAMQIVPDKIIPTYNNYFIGNDPSKWAGDCRIFQAITLKEVYPNVDVRYYTNNGFLKYDIIAKPGADISKIALRYKGIDKIELKSKELMLSTSIGQLRESSPYTYQSNEKEKKEIICKYKIKDDVVRFDIKDYDPSATLVIDPVLIFCSFSGSTTDNWGFTATYGPDGSMFGGGIVFGNGFPTSPGAFQTSFQGGSGGGEGAIDIGIIKLSPNGSNRIYGTYIGGAGNEQPHSLIVDAAGNLILAGRSNSDNYPTLPAGTKIGPGGSYDIIVTKLNAAGNGLIGSKKIGGSGDDGVNISPTRAPQSLQRNYGDDGRSEVLLDGAGNIYVASSTQSANFPVTAGAFQTIYGNGGQDGVVLKFNPNLSSALPLFSSYLGGSGKDAAYVLALGPSGDIYVAGGTESFTPINSNTATNNFPGNHAGTIGTNFAGGIDGFIAQISNNGSSLIRSTYLGTSGTDQVFGVQFDNKGFPYVMGQTTGAWPVINAAYSNAGGKQFIAKLQPDLSAYVYSTVFGSGGATPNISPIAFLVDRCENVYISGWGGHIGTDNNFGSAGTSGLPVTPDAIKSITDGKDFYFFVLKKDATSQLFGSFYGENNQLPNFGVDHVDGGTSRFDKNGVIYQAICGNCNLGARQVYPTTPGAWSTVNSATTPGCNLTMLKIALNLAGVASGVNASINGVPRDTSGCVPLTVDFTDTVRNAVSYVWNFGDGSPDTATIDFSISHTYNFVGTYQVMLVAIDPNTCNVRDTSYSHIRVGDIRATLNFNPVKLLPCDSFKYRFDNLSLAPPVRPFGAQSFIWDFGDGSPTVTSGLDSIFHNFSGPGTYTVKQILQDTNYCNSPDSLVIQLRVAALVKAQFTTPPFGCVPYTAVFNNSSLAGQSFEWDFGDGNTSTAINPTHLYNSTGTYIITLVANDPSTCNLTDTTRFTISVFDNPVADFDYAPNPPLQNTPTRFTNLSSADAILFKWDFGDGDTLKTFSRLPVQHQYNATGTFIVCLTASNSAGCSDSTCLPVQALIFPLVDIPNAFTPNSNDINSKVLVKGFGIAKMRFAIWNRWGQKVFETSNRFQGWDGKVNGVVQPMDVYAYTLDVEFFDGEKTTLKGDITLIR